jgi:riboflavin synthase
MCLTGRPKMFTGIIEEVGRVGELRLSSASARIAVACSAVLEGSRVGDSIAVNGACLTVTKLEAGGFEADAMPETIRRTTLSGLRSGEQVNLERALRLSDRLGGHIVNGHIDGTGVVESVEAEANAVWVRVSASPEVLKYVVEKGSVAVDGVSLTVAGTGKGTFTVSLIPHTFKITALIKRRPGDRVNIECDILGKYIEKLLGRTPAAGIGMEFLKDNGFA